MGYKNIYQDYVYVIVYYVKKNARIGATSVNNSHKYKWQIYNLTNIIKMICHLIDAFIK